MNITTATPVSLPVNTANIPTETIQTENRLAERIPESKQTFESVASRANETGPNQSTNQANQQEAAGAKPRIVGDKEQEQEKDQSQNQSSEERQAQQEERQEQAVISELAAIDRKVRAHEQAHSAVGGSQAGAPSYTYTTGPNGKRYAVGGEVPIRLSVVPGDPQQTLRNAEQVARAALAPADPSPTDRRVAAAANAVAAKARYEITRQNSEKDESTVRFNRDNEEDERQGPLPFEIAGTSLNGSRLNASLKTDATEQVGGQVSASA